MTVLLKKEFPNENIMYFHVTFDKYCNIIAFNFARSTFLENNINESFDIFYITVGNFKLPT